MDTHRYITLQHDSKIPDTNHWNYVDKDGATAHLAAGGNLALATGERSGLFVLDVDVKNGAGGQETLDRVQEIYGLLPPTRMISTPSGGAHFYFSYPPAWKHTTSAGKIGKGIDTRCNGGYVVMPPSRIGGGVYEVVVDTTPWPLPEWIMRSLDAKPVDVVASYKRQYGRQRGPRGFEAIIATMAKAQEGGRNALLNWAAYKMFQEGAGSQDITLLAEAAIAAGLGTHEIERTIQSAARAAGK
jgi:hypothetical protein